MSRASTQPPTIDYTQVRSPRTLWVWSAPGRYPLHRVPVGLWRGALRQTRCRFAGSPGPSQCSGRGPVRSSEGWDPGSDGGRRVHTRPHAEVWGTGTWGLKRVLRPGWRPGASPGRLLAHRLWVWVARPWVFPQGAGPAGARHGRDLQPSRGQWGPVAHCPVGPL